MKRKIFMVLAVGLFVGAVPAAVLADIEYSGDVGNSSDQMAQVVTDSEGDSMSGPVGTGAIPTVNDPSTDRLSPLDSHFNPFYPELRGIDQGGGGE